MSDNPEIKFIGLIIPPGVSQPWRCPSCGGSDGVRGTVCVKCECLDAPPGVSQPSWREAFHAAWSADRGDGERRPDYDKEAWMYVQAKMAEHAPGVSQPSADGLPPMLPPMPTFADVVAAFQRAEAALAERDAEVADLRKLAFDLGCEAGQPVGISIERLWGAYRKANERADSAGAERDAALRRAEDNLKWAADYMREPHRRSLIGNQLADSFADGIERGPQPTPNTSEKSPERSDAPQRTEE